MKEDDKTRGRQPEERDGALVEKREGVRPGNYGPKDGKELLDAAYDLLRQWAEMCPEHRGLVLAAVDIDIVLGEDGLDTKLTKCNGVRTAVIGLGGAVNFAAVVAIEGKEPLRLARKYLKQS